MGVSFRLSASGGFSEGESGPPAADALGTLKTIPISHADIGPNELQAVTDLVSSPNPTIHVPTSASITINDNGWFFSGGATIGGLETGTPRFQGETLLHELGHATGVLLPDQTSSRNESINVAAIKRNCAKALNGLSATPQ